jgi:hypothetical protein
MKYTVITTFNAAGLETYGQKMIDTFEKYWPANVDLIVFTENCQPRVTRANTTVVDLLSASGDLREFIERHRDNPLAHGKAGPPDVFNPKKQFRWDAVRFCYKVFAKSLAADMIDSGWMIWVDADTVTHTPVSMQFLNSVCPNKFMISYLGRGEKYHSECGWVAYNLDAPECRQFVRDFVNMYNRDDIFQQREWHDSYIFDVLRKQFQDRCRFHNLNPSHDDKGLAGHPFINSELGKHMDHVKGDRKVQGHSKPKEVVLHQDHPYWQNVLSKGRR